MDPTLTEWLPIIGTAVGSFGGIIASARLTNYRIKKLEEKVDKHNCLVERMAVVEVRVDKIEEFETREGK